MSAGTPDKARSVSSTVTLNDAVTGLVASSVNPKHVTVVVPIGNVLPDGVSQLTGGGAGSSSESVGGTYVTTAPVVPVASTVMSAGTPTSVASVSFTVTEKLNAIGLRTSSPSVAVAVHETIVVPMGKRSPGEWSQLTVAPPSSVAVGGV